MVAVLEQTENAPFGAVFASKMALCWFKEGRWEPAKIQDIQPLPLHPAAHVLHYASGCFEGLKAYRWEDRRVRIFRLPAHVERMRRSAELLCLPPPSTDLLTSMICDLVGACRDEVPPFPGSLYIRPTLIGTQPNVGAAASPPNELCLYVLVSPVGDYFSGGQQPLRVVVDDQHMRSTPGFGMAKTGANYAAALAHIQHAKQTHSADQVLFCPGGDVQETGASNFLLLNDREIVTKGLDTSFLHGITRDSALCLGARLGYRVIERNFTVTELLEWVRTGEAALSGTAAVLTGVGTLIYRGREIAVKDGQVGPNTQKLREALTAIQRGEAPDEFGWLISV